MAECSELNQELIVSLKFPEWTFTYSERDATIYALGVGACGRDAMDETELKYVYHEDGQQFIKVLPTFAAIFSLESIPNILLVPGLQFDRRLLLHGHQYIEIYKPLPSSGCIHNKATIAGLHDKGKAAIIEFETTSYEKESGGKYASTGQLSFYGVLVDSQVHLAPSPTQNIQLVKIQQLKFQSANLLRFMRTIYNHLRHCCTVSLVTIVLCIQIPSMLKMQVRAIIKCICNGDQDLIRSISSRFILNVCPGESLITEMWIQGSRVIYQAKVKEGNRTVLSGHVDLKHITSPL